MNDTITRPPLPPIIILYGPPGAGKGTQSYELSKILVDYEQVDFGTLFRNFIKEFESEDKSSDIYKIVNGISPHDRAVSIKGRMNVGQLAGIDDLKYIVQPVLDSIFQKGGKVILQGPGRMVEEAEWLSHYFKMNNLSSCIIHLHISLEDVLKRVTNRYFVPGSSTPYKSYEEALLHCPPGIKPERRKDDEDVNLVVSRYRNQYKKSFAKLLFIYQLKAHSDVIIVDASSPVEQVAYDIQSYLFQYYAYPQNVESLVNKDI